MNDESHPLTESELMAQGNQHGKPAGLGPAAAPFPRKPVISALAAAAFVMALVQLGLGLLPIDFEDSMGGTEASLPVLLRLAASHQFPTSIVTFTAAGIPLVALPVAAIFCGSIGLARITARQQTGRALARTGVTLGILEALAGTLLIVLTLRSHTPVAY